MSPLVPFELRGRRVFVAGHRGMVGAAIARRLASEDCELLTADRKRLDLTRQSEVEHWFDDNRPDAVFLAAARVGGIHANDVYPADFIVDNLQIELNVMRSASAAQVRSWCFSARPASIPSSRRSR